MPVRQQRAGIQRKVFYCTVNKKHAGIKIAAQKNQCFSTRAVHSHPTRLSAPAGIVTTTRITHATPAALYAKSAHRNWECDGKLGKQGKGCVDIARQLVENAPGKFAKVRWLAVG